jgi:probable O-glycosylation ligase (exosortase A-associated)
MGIPMLLHLALAEKNDLVRRATLVIIPLQAMSIVATHSRGAFLALSMTILLLVWRSPNRIAGFAILFFLGIAGVIAAPKSYTERISTIGTYEQDASAMGRLRAWKVAGNMIVANPFLGVGYNKFQYNYKNYDPNALTVSDGSGGESGTRVAHNSYLQIWAECGTPAFFIYLSLIGLSFFDIWSVRREAKRRYHSSWILSYCTMFEASMLAFVVGSIFLNRAQFDLFYHFVALIIVFGRVAREAMAEEPVIAGGNTARGALELAPAHGFGLRKHDGGFDRPARPSGFDKGTAFGSS